MRKNFFQFFKASRRIRRIKIERFIKKLYHKAILSFKGFIISREIARKTYELAAYICEICFTGIIIYYAITHFNWLSVGLISALTMYYIKWFVSLIKTKEE